MAELTREASGVHHPDQALLLLRPSHPVGLERSPGEPLDTSLSEEGHPGRVAEDRKNGWMEGRKEGWKERLGRDSVFDGRDGVGEEEGGERMDKLQDFPSGVGRTVLS